MRITDEDNGSAAVAAPVAPAQPSPLVASALTFREFTPGDVTAYDARGFYQGRIVPARDGYEVHTVECGVVRQFHLVAGWFASLDDAKHGFVGLAA